MHQGVQWKWTKGHIEAVWHVKNSLMSDQSLTHYNSNLPITLSCDASPVDIGAVIFHTYANGQEKPIAFASRKLTSSEKNYAQIQKEALGIVYGVQKFRQYLLGRQFCLRTDHKPLVTIFHPKKGISEVAASRRQRWAIILSAYDYTVEYEPTKSHGNSDGLSRLPIDSGQEIHTDDSEDIVCALEQGQIQLLPVQARNIAELPLKIQFCLKCTIIHYMGGQHQFKLFHVH